MNTALALQRTPELIAAEINRIKDQTKTMILYNSIEIGRRLCEAKQFIPHGEWGKWLETSVDYSQSTANNLMRIFDEYGAEQLTLFDDLGAKSQALGKLGYTQAVALLGLPAGEREDFIKDHDIDSMSTRELQQAIKERDQALKDLEADTTDVIDSLMDQNKKAKEENTKLQDNLSKEREQAKERHSKLETLLTDTQKKLAEAQESGNSEDIERLKADLEEADAQLLNANKEIEELNKQLKDKPIDVQAAQVVEKVPEEIEQELQDLRKKAGTAKFATYFDVLVKSFNDLLGTLAEISDEEIQGKYKNAVKGLIGKMNERL
ncbi:MAG: DUF3102 domain-containing protein [Syntrophomonas sp.]